MVKQKTKKINLRKLNVGKSILHQPSQESANAVTDHDIKSAVCFEMSNVITVY